MKVAAVVLSLFLALATDAKIADQTELYENHKLLDVMDPPEALQGFLDRNFVDIYDRGPTHVQFRVSPQQYRRFQQEFPNVKAQVVIDDIGALVAEETERLNAVELEGNFVANLDDEYFTEYRTYDQAKESLQTFAREHWDLVRWVPSIGKSHEGRDLFALRIGKGSGTNKKKIFFQGQQHAREWISTATVQWIVYQLVSQYGSDDLVTSLLDDVEFVIVPIVNPDGYHHSWERERLWRKNRRDNGGSWGVDTNRNWDHKWASGGASRNPRADDYHGPSVLSEPEVKAVTDLYRSEPGIIASIDFHSFSQLILRPWGDTRTNSPHEAEFVDICGQMRDIIRDVSGQSYTSQKGIDLYITTGTAGDYFYAETHRDNAGRNYHAYGITLELRPRSRFGPGFRLPPDQIIPTGQEIFPAALAYADYARNNILYE